jgi:hypothetical protein
MYVYGQKVVLIRSPHDGVFHLRFLVVGVPGVSNLDFFWIWAIGFSSGVGFNHHAGVKASPNWREVGTNWDGTSD